MNDSLRGPGRNFTPNETCRKLNPQVFGGNRNPVCRVETSSAEPSLASALDCSSAQRQSGQGGLGSDRYRVAFTVYCRKLMDAHDSLRASLKPLADAVAQSLHGGTLGQYDGLVTWEYGQQKTTGVQGVAVRIERIIL